MVEKKRLLDALQEIQVQLSSGKQVDDDVRESLLAVTQDITRMLDDQEETTAEESKNLTDRWYDMVARFEAEHPDLTSLITRVSDGLANLGI